MNHGRPGTHLKRMLESIGITPKESCPCDAVAAEMDRWGIDGCFVRRTRLAHKLKQNASKWSWHEKFRAGMAAISTGLAFSLRLSTPYLGLIEEAIHRARVAFDADPSGESEKAQPKRSARVAVVLPRCGAAATPIPAAISDVRNLIYHIWPARQTDHWRWNIQQLRARLDLFNGVRSIGVVLDSQTVSLEEVQAEFGGTRIDNWIVHPNNPKRREGVTFIDLMNTLTRDDSVTCYGHAKGVRHHAGSLTIDWAEMLYRTTMEHWPLIAESLRRFPVTGAFKRYGTFRVPKNNHWHYSGAFFWFRNRETFSRPAWSYLHPTFFACVEAWPANVYTATEAGCIFGDNAGDLYRPEELNKHIAALASRETEWSESK